MRIAQLLLDNASEYERKCQRVDFAALSSEHDVQRFDSTRRVRGFDVVHVYGALPRLTWLRVPRVVEREHPELPEAVEEAYFAAGMDLHDTQTAGVFVRKSIMAMIERTRARIARTRDDVDWRLFDRPPSPEELAGVRVWFDPAASDDDRDGFTAEALVAGCIVVAGRNSVNLQRLEKGRTGFLVPPHDANEATHAILSALFKPEIGGSRAGAARQTISKFKPRQRMRALRELYQTMSR